ncbi:MAG: HD-GYP domain-containing protein [Desulfovibrionaceae bacterium]
MIRKLPIAQLEPGMVVARMRSDVWEHNPYLYTEPGPVPDQAAVDHIRAQGYTEVFVEVEVPAGEDPEEVVVARQLDRRELAMPAPPKVPLAKEMRAAQKIYARSLEQARKVVDAVAEGRALDVEGSRVVVDDIINSAVRNAQTMTCLAKLDTYDDYTYSHCVNVAALSVVVGQFLGLERPSLMLLGLAGLFHDLGKTRIDKRILNKPGRLNADEFEEMKKHPGYSRDILAGYGDMPPEVVRAAAEHHEKYNGLGYPDHLPHEGLSPLSRILSMADVFDALTSRRPYKDAMLPGKALSLMYGMRDQDFATRDVELFVKCLGVYPTGSLVRLTDGRLAVVVENRPQALLKPLLRVLPPNSALIAPPKLLDLLQDPVGLDGEPVRVEAVVDARQARRDLGALLGVALPRRL